MLHECCVLKYNSLLTSKVISWSFGTAFCTLAICRNKACSLSPLIAHSLFLLISIFVPLALGYCFWLCFVLLSRNKARRKNSVGLIEIIDRYTQQNMQHRVHRPKIKMAPFPVKTAQCDASRSQSYSDNLTSQKYFAPHAKLHCFPWTESRLTSSWVNPALKSFRAAMPGDAWHHHRTPHRHLLHLSTGSVYRYPARFHCETACFLTARQFSSRSLIRADLAPCRGHCIARVT